MATPRLLSSGPTTRSRLGRCPPLRDPPQQLKKHILGWIPYSTTSGRHLPPLFTQPSPSGPLAQSGNAVAHWRLAAGSHPRLQARDKVPGVATLPVSLARRRDRLLASICRATHGVPASPALGRTLPCYAHGNVRPTTGGASPPMLIVTLRPTRRLGLIQHPPFA